ncbi:WhiB family transcriptional regulator [Corynebacterium coyleae]|uniref:WhiB family transcriptional regulator n=1 Tax=Corynebacterium coyleae TaxID=53374 RepID=UPI00254DA4F0|nr:WhiB family transcriptional regulator [Corynebacterium coyleae]MDK8241681.1 WhiB family transcriptional regulator [Corynebacterium coyleae]
MDGAKCTYQDRELFTNPAERDAPSTLRAIQICETCPIIQQCAKNALTAGSSIDFTATHPAVGVIQAGVYCDGTDRAAMELGARAGEPAPIVEVQPRAKVGDRCKNCGLPMVRWTRDRVPEGYRMHRGRGYCTKCRKAYNEELARARANGEVRGGLRKQIDRKRHTAPPRRDREVAIQFTLFEREALV